MAIEFLSAESVRIGRGGKGSGRKYGRYADAIKPLVPTLKAGIAKEGTILIKAKDIGKEMGGDFKTKNETSIYWGLKYSLFFEHIIVETGTHKDGSKVLKMRARDEADILPPSLDKHVAKDDVDSKSNVSEPSDELEIDTEEEEIPEE
jgi:hypothetical protein